MMSESRYRLHWVTAIIESAKTLKEMILPLIVLFAADGLSGSGSGKWYFDYGPFIIFGLLIISFFVTGIIKWKRFVYWFEEGELRIEYGLFVRKKRYIPFDRIQSLDYTEGIFHRPFKLVRVKVETAGGSATESEAELTAITLEAAKHIEMEMAEAKKRKVAISTVDGEILEEVESEVTSIFQMSAKELLILATTSGGIGLILSGAFLFIMQFGDLLPLDLIFEEVSGFVKSGLIIIVATVFVGLLIVWGISVLLTYLSYYKFAVSLEDEDIVITRGLIEKKRATIPLNRVQSVRVIENPIRKLFGYAVVVIDNAGGGLGDGATIKLFPIVKKSAVQGPLQLLFPALVLDEPTIKLPRRSIRYYYRIDFVWMVPLIGALTYFFYPYGLLSLLVIPVVILFGLWRHRSAAYGIFENQLTMRFRMFNLQTAYLLKRRIQSIEMKQNYFHRRKDVATISARIKSGMGAFTAQVSHMENTDAERILNWYKPPDIKK